MGFILGCNYWASNAGTEMWKQWNSDSVEDDLKILSENGVKYLRVFPNWRDFQPVTPVLTVFGDVLEYRMSNDEKPDNVYYLDHTMMKKFYEFCRLCEKYNIYIIVGLLTGWMSGRLFIPPALVGKKLFSDPIALYFEQLYIRGFVTYFKKEKQIIAWEHGNECGCLDRPESTEQSAMWTAIISNAVKSVDHERMLISGLHNLNIYDKWRICDQAEYTDMLGAHPYPFWNAPAKMDKITNLRTLLYPVARSKFYSDISGLPCFIKEVGTMGNSVCSDTNSEKFLKAVMFSAWENGIKGVMWWCANEQLNLNTLPYEFMMCETELGLIDKNRKPKPVLYAMKEFDKFINSLEFELPKLNFDACCLTTHGQDQFGVSFMSYILSKQAGFDIKIAYADDGIPECDTYLMPSYNGNNIMHKDNYLNLKNKVRNGADLYISYDEGIISEFEELTGLRIENTEHGIFKNKIEINSEEIEFVQNSRLDITVVSAKILISDKYDMPIITKNKYGKGNVYFVSFPIESMLLNKTNAFVVGYSQIYKLIFKNIINRRPVISNNKELYITNHYENDILYCVISNYSDVMQNMDLIISNNYKAIEFFNNVENKCKPYESVIIKFKHL